MKLELKATREKSFMYGNMLIPIQVVTTRSRSFNGCSIVRALKVNSSWTTWQTENIEIKVKIELELITKIKTKQNKTSFNTRALKRTSFSPMAIIVFGSIVTLYSNVGQFLFK